jgi:arylformamidase
MTAMPGTADPDDVVVHDLSFALSPEHFRWPVRLSRTADLGAGDPFQTTRFETSAHAFTHADAPSHVAGGGPSVDRLPLTMFVGPAGIVDLSDAAADEPLTADRVSRRGRHLRAGDIALLRTDWDRRRSIDTPEYWTSAPFVTEGAARWLAGCGVRAVGFDFPQDLAIRSELTGGRPDAAEFVTHRLLLAQGIGLVEYLRGLGQVRTARVFFSAAPIKINGSDGSPVRAYAIERRPGPGTSDSTRGDQ